MSSASRNIRRDALQKIAALSAKTSINFDYSDLERLSKGCLGKSNAQPNGNGNAKGGPPTLETQPMVCANIKRQTTFANSI